MKIRTKVFLAAGVFLLLALSIYFFIPKKNVCDETGVVFLKPSESGQASQIADSINGVVFIPEQGKMIGRTETLKCDFDYTNLFKPFN